MITYAIKTTFAMSAAKPPAHVALPRESQYVLFHDTHEQLTLEDKVDSEEVRADRQRDHGKGEAHQLPDNRSVVLVSRSTSLY